MTETNEKWSLISEDKKSLKQGFIRLPYDDINLYKKNVDVSEITAYYRIWKQAVYKEKDYDFVDGGREDFLLLITYDLKIAQKYGLDKVFNIGEFGFYVPLKDITFKEIKVKKKIDGVQWWSDDEPIETYITFKL